MSATSDGLGGGAAAPSPDSIEALFARYGPRYRWIATATCMLGAMTVVLSMTTVNVAFPDIMGAFGIGRDKAQLLSSGYMAAMTAGMVLAAWLVSIFGERLTYFAMLTVFVAGSAMSGVATDETVLNSGRLLQGVAAGVIQPLTMAVTFKVFPPHRRGTAMGLYAMGIVFAPAIGPTLGGLAIELYNWRYVFFITLPPAVLSGVVGLAFMPSKRVERPIPEFDYLGFALLCTALFTLMLGLSSGQREGWGSDYILGLLGTGTLAAAAFVVWERVTAHPLVDLRVFGFARFSAAAALAFIAGGVFISSTFLIPVFVQEMQGFTPVQAGLLLMPGGLSLLVLFPLAGRISDRVPAHLLVAGGLASFVLAFALFTAIDVNTSFWTIVGWTLFIRIGLGFTTPIVNTVALQAVPGDLVNQASGAVSLGRQLGSAFGTVCVVAYLERRIPFHGEAFASLQADAGAAGAEMLRATRRLLSEAGVSEAHQGSGALHYLGEVLEAQASILGFQDAFGALAVLSIAGLMPAAILAWRPRE